MEKKYGRLTEDQFKRLIRKLPEIRKSKEEMQGAFRTASPEKLRAMLGDGIWWAPMYELSFTVQFAVLTARPHL